jgi:LDH2 family malate/lactate/ureidoglycolate dehydrogenase
MNDKHGIDLTLCRYQAQELISFSRNVLSQLGVLADDAEEVGTCLVDANLRGIDSHGIVRLPVYAKRLQAGRVKAQPDLKILHSTGPVKIIDGDNGLGPVVGTYAMHQAIEAAKTFGVGLATARHSNHFGPAGHYVSKAVAAGCIGLASSNAPPNMAPWGGRERFLGTNPLAIGVPTAMSEPLHFDMATSVVARGKIILAAQRGEPIPEGWAVDREGFPTRDAQQALLGAVLPFGGPKGSAISLTIDMLSGVLSGAAYGKHLHTLEDLNNEQNLGHFFLAVDVEKFMPYEEFCQRSDDLLTQLRTVPPAQGFSEVLAPGDPERHIMTLRGREGIALTQDVVAQLLELGREVGVNDL